MGINNWNSKSVTPKVEGNQATAFYNGWINYKKADGSWSPIDCTLTQDILGFHMTKATFEFHAPLMSDGEATFIANNRYDVFAKKDITADPFSQTMKAFEVNSVAGEPYYINGELVSVKYPNAYGIGIHLVYYVHYEIAPRLEKLIQFDQELLVDTEYEFEITYSGKAEISPRRLPENTTRRQHRNASDDILNTPKRLPHDEGFYIRKDKESQKRGIGIKTPLIWDSGEEAKVEGIDVDIRKGAGANKYILTKHIKTSFFTGVTYPVFTDTTFTGYPDPHPETLSVDGDTRYFASGKTFAQLLAGAGLQSTDSAIRIENTISSDGSGYSNLKKAIVSVDTSAIGTDIVISGDWGIKPQLIADNTGLSASRVFNIVSATTSPDTAVNPADHLSHGSVKFASDVNYSSLVVGTYAVFTLNAQGLAHINGSGISKFGLNYGCVITGVDPLFPASKFALVRWNSAELGISNSPVLTLDHVVLTVSTRRTKVIKQNVSGGMNV